MQCKSNNKKWATGQQQAATTTTRTQQAATTGPQQVAIDQVEEIQPNKLIGETFVFQVIFIQKAKISFI